MKRRMVTVLVVAMLLSMTACSLFSDGGSGSNESGNAANDSQSEIKLSDSFTHKDPTDIEFEKRYVLYSAQNAQLLGYYKEDYDVEVVEQFFILYGDKDDVAVRSYDYYVCATEEDALKLQESINEFGGNATVEGDVAICVTDKDALQDTLETYVGLNVLEGTTASEFAQANKEQFSELVDYVD